MKRLGSSDSLGALMSICPSTDELSPRGSNHYGREFQSMLDGLDEDAFVEESGGHAAPKKRRLGVDQVKALEKNFELENKLEPERKVKLAQELGLQPRQVAIWFQNRRARWKTKQLERDYGVLKADYESLKINYDSLQHNNEALLKEIRDLKAKLSNDNAESNSSVREEIILPESEDKLRKKQPLILDSAAVSETKDLIHESFNDNNAGLEMAPFFSDVKDGSSDSDSSAILNEDNSPNQAMSSSAGLESHGELLMSPPQTLMNCFEFSSSRSYNQTQFTKMEEHNFFGNEETCNFFSDEQAPTLQWCCPDQWT